MTTLLTYTSSLKEAFEIAKSLAKEFQNESYGAAHLLKALLHNEVGLAAQLAEWGKDIHYLRDWADIRIGDYPKTGRLKDDLGPDQDISKVLEVADMMRLKLGEELLSPLAIFATLCKPNLVFSADKLKSFSITEKDILEATLNDVSPITNGASPKGKANGSASTITNQTIAKYCIDKTAIAAEGGLDPIVGRDKEIRLMTEILCRRTKPNVVIVGEPGVGKTALVDGFAQNIQAGEVPTFLQNAILLELDLGALIAGASYKGEIEDRMRKIIKEIKQYEKAILFIDEIHIIIDPAGGISGLANLLKPELARGNLTVIGATTNAEYRQHIEADDAFSRRFGKITAEEPDEKTAVRMLQTLLDRYTTHHKIEVEDGVLTSAVQLAKRYIKDRRLPDAAIDLMDRTMASLRLIIENGTLLIEAIQEELQVLIKEETDKKIENLNWFFEQINARLSPILIGKLNTILEPESIDDPKVLGDALTKMIKDLLALSKKQTPLLSPVDLAAVVAYNTGIPIGKIQTKEKERLLGMESILQQRVIGQDIAIKALSESVLQSRAGLSRPGLPIGSFFLLGPTGTGKTELAKSLAEFLFNDENALIRFDMSEFKEEHSVALLYGAPPGYIGYKEGGLLVNKIRQQPYSVVLFDEIEKAHASVFDVFLQILDEGKLHDKLGKTGNFSNAIILFTSNVGADYMVQKMEEGHTPDTAEMREVMESHFKKEFLGRINEVLPFAPIAKENIIKIFEIQLRSLHKMLKRKGISLEVSEKALQELAYAGFDPKFGARPLRAVIRNQLVRPISRKIISDEVSKGNILKVDWKDNGLLWSISDSV